MRSRSRKKGFLKDCLKSNKSQGAVGESVSWALVNVCMECIGQSGDFVRHIRTQVSACDAQNHQTVRSNPHSTIDTKPRSPIPRQPLSVIVRRKGKMKKKCIVSVLMGLVLSVSGCGGDKVQESETRTEEGTDVTDGDSEEGGETEAEASVNQQVTYADLKSSVTSLGEYKGLTAERVVAEVTDEDVEDEIWSVQKSYANLQDVDRGAQMRDVTVIDYTGYVDGETSDSLKGEGYELELGSGAFVPGFEDQLIGVKAGEDREVVLTFPEDYYEDMAGKEARFEVHVQKVQEYVMEKEWNDAFIKENLEYEDEADMRAKIREEFQKNAEEDADANMEYELMQQVIGSSTYEIQETDVKAYTDEMMQEYQIYAAMYGLGLEDYLAQQGTTEENVRMMYRETAEFRVKLILTLHEIAKAEQITASEEECQSTLEELAVQYGYEDTKEVEAVYGRDMVQEQLVQEKVLDFIRENANN